MGGSASTTTLRWTITWLQMKVVMMEGQALQPLFLPSFLLLLSLLPLLSCSLSSGGLSWDGCRGEENLRKTWIELKTREKPTLRSPHQLAALTQSPGARACSTCNRQRSRSILMIMARHQLKSSHLNTLFHIIRPAQAS